MAEKESRDGLERTSGRGPRDKEGGLKVRQDQGLSGTGGTSASDSDGTMERVTCTGASAVSIYKCTQH